MIRKIFTLCVILLACTSCSEFALLASGSSIALSQNTYAKVYNGADILTIMTTDKDIKRHVYDRIKGNLDLVEFLKLKKNDMKVW